jgi:hypothetical protein
MKNWVKWAIIGIAIIIVLIILGGVLCTIY